MSLSEAHKKNIQAAFQIAIGKHPEADEPIGNWTIRYKHDGMVLPLTLRRFWTAQSVDSGYLLKIEKQIQAGRYSLDEVLEIIRNFDLNTPGFG